MSIEFSNIIKGIKYRVFNKKQTSNYPPLTWVQQKILKHQEDRQVKTLQIGALHLLYRRPYEILHTYPELFSDEIYRFSTTKSNPLIIDCGANIGMSVLYFKSLYPNSRIIAFEPDSDNCRLLKDNIGLNKFSGVEVNQAAVWVRDEVLSFNSSGSQGSKIATDVEQTSNQPVQVNAIRLATLLDKEPVDFLKIDIEGAEYEVMKDCEQSLSNVKNLFLEYHGKVSDTSKLHELLNIVNAAGFKLYIKMAADNLRTPFEKKETGDEFDVQLNLFCYR